MKKAKEVTAQDMLDEADARTQESAHDAYSDCLEAWEKLIDPYHGEKRDYAESGVFKDACEFLVAREQDICKGVYADTYFIMRQEVKKILSFSFNYDYDRFSWDEKTYDTEDYDAFELFSETDELPCAYLKREVVGCLRSFLLTGAVLAKKIGSDTYERWRKLIAVLDYTHDLFEYGAKEEEVEAFIDSMDEAAELYVVDAEVKARLDMTKTPKRGKRPRKRGEGGIL